MGVNNRQRRAAKKRKTSRGWGSSADYLTGADRAAGCGCPECAVFSDGGGPGPAEQSAAAREWAVGELVAQVLGQVITDPAEAERVASQLHGPDNIVPLGLVVTSLQSLERDVVLAVVEGGWSPTDLGQLTRRQVGRAGARHVLALVATATQETAAGGVSPQWRADLVAAGAAERADPTTPTGLTTLLRVLAALAVLPTVVPVLPVLGRPVAASRSTATTDPLEAKLLARVQSLLIKAESTEFDAEADALSAKAQQLISRHALEDLLGQTPEQQVEVGAARVWIDAPYVLPKAGLVEAVAAANRCRAVVDQKLGFSTIVGAAGDLRAVQLLVSSLLVQASVSMRREGSQTDRYGRSTTTSFRSAFLSGFAYRIGDRLHEAREHATAETAESTGRAGELVPVLARHDEAVEQALHEMFPGIVEQPGSRMLNGRGWAAGLASADLALLDTRGAVAGSR